VPSCKAFNSLYRPVYTDIPSKVVCMVACTYSGELTATVTAPDHTEVPTKVARHDTVYDVSFLPTVTGQLELLCPTLR